MERKHYFVFWFIVFCTSTIFAVTIDLGALDWSVQYMIDTSQSDFGQSQSPYPRDNRGLGMSPDGRYIYAGYNNGGGLQQVRKIDLSQSDYIDASVANVTGVRGKSIDVDDAGRVYLAEGSSIKIYDADLTTLLHTITTTKCEGVAVRRESGTLALYATDRTDKTLTRWDLTESGADITTATQAGLDGDGQVTLSAASSLRGLNVDSSGKIWMTDISGNQVFRMDNDGTNLTSVSVDEPIDVDFDGDLAFITQYTERTISVLSLSDMSIENTLSIPWVDLELDPDGQSSYGALSGIVIVPGKGFYVANEAGQTVNEKSTYGRTDGNSGMDGGTFFTDLYYDDNDPILFATPEPATICLLGLGFFSIIRKK